MKSLLLLLPVVVLAGCATFADSPSYYRTEASRYSDISFDAHSFAERCQEHGDIRSDLEELMMAAGRAEDYSAMNERNPRIAQGGKIVSALIFDLQRRYAVSVPSMSYCRAKLSEAAEFAQRVSEVVGTNRPAADFSPELRALWSRRSMEVLEAPVRYSRIDGFELLP